MPLAKNQTIRFWSVQICAITVFALFVNLGLWQLGRGDVKSGIETAENSSVTIFESIALPLESLEQWRYKRVKFYGVYDHTKQFLLDNQVRDGVAGYNVLTPFFIESSKKWLLVDRGWVPQEGDRSVFPLIEVDSKGRDLLGSVYVPYAEAYRLGGIADGEDESWPRRIQFVDYKQLSSRLGIELEPFTLRLDPEQANGYRRDWGSSSLPANKHYGYAFQWFAMAFAVIVLWWVYSIQPLLRNNAD